MRSIRFVNPGIITTTATILALFVFSAFAAPDALPNAKYAAKVKVIDAQNKKVGFIGLESGSLGGFMIFTSGNRWFQVGIDRSGLFTVTPQFYKSADCTGPVFFRVGSEDKSLLEDAILKEQPGGYAVYLADVDVQEQTPTSLLSFYSPSFALGPSECQIIEWPDGNGTFYFQSGEQIRPGKNVTNLNFTPPFSLKK